MASYSQLIIIRAARDFDVEDSIYISHIKSRKDVYPNILRDFALSTFKDREKARQFIKYIKKLSQGSRKWH
jgi:hypothetical protein